MAEAKGPEKKVEKKVYSRQLIVDFVDLMMLADHIVAEYKKRREDDGQGFVEDLSFHERAQLAGIFMSLQVKDALVEDAEVRRAAFEKMKELEAIREKEQAGDASKVRIAEQMPVRLDPEKVSKAFSMLAESHGVPNARARDFVKLLLGTPQGQQMLQMLTYESVMRNQAEQKKRDQKALDKTTNPGGDLMAGG